MNNSSSIPLTIKKFSNVFNIDGTPYTFEPTKWENLAYLREAVNTCFDWNNTDMSQKHWYDTVQKYLSITRFPNLLNQDYGPAIRSVWRVILEEIDKWIKLKDIPHIFIVLTILCGLHLHSKSRVFIPWRNEEFLKELDEFIQLSVKRWSGHLHEISFISNFRNLSDKWESQVPETVKGIQVYSTRIIQGWVTAGRRVA
jgi:hypothetical protein